MGSGGGGGGPPPPSRYGEEEAWLAASYPGIVVGLPLNVFLILAMVISGRNPLGRVCPLQDTRSDKIAVSTTSITRASWCTPSFDRGALPFAVQL